MCLMPLEIEEIAKFAKHTRGPNSQRIPAGHSHSRLRVLEEFGDDYLSY